MHLAVIHRDDMQTETLCCVLEQDMSNMCHKPAQKGLEHLSLCRCLSYLNNRQVLKSLKETGIHAELGVYMEQHALRVIEEIARLCPRFGQ